MRIQRNLGSTAVNIFDTKIEMPPPHESVSGTVIAKYIKMTFRIQQAAAEEEFLAKPKFFLSRPKFVAKPAYRSRFGVYDLI